MRPLLLPLLPLLLAPLSAQAATWRDARAAAADVLAGRKAALSVSRDARGLTYRVAVPNARGERNYEFLHLSNGDLTLKPVQVFDVSRRGLDAPSGATIHRSVTAPAGS